MRLRARVRAGVLLYALLMSMVFAMVLQCYLARVAAVARQEQAQLLASQALLMAQLTAEGAKAKEGQCLFEGGQTRYRKQGDKVTVTVAMAQGATYTYQMDTNE